MRRLPVFALMLAAAPVWAAESVLTYQGDNHWVAQADNKPLVKLLGVARSGVRHFTVKLPTEGRALAIERLDVLTGLLSREAKGAVVIEEASGSAKANTLVIQTLK